jgi:hypothetical protein
MRLLMLNIWPCEALEAATSATHVKMDTRGHVDTFTCMYKHLHTCTTHASTNRCRGGVEDDKRALVCLLCHSHGRKLRACVHTRWRQHDMSTCGNIIFTEDVSRAHMSEEACHWGLEQHRQHIPKIFVDMCIKAMMIMITMITMIMMIMMITRWHADSHCDFWRDLILAEQHVATCEGDVARVMCVSLRNCERTRTPLAVTQTCVMRTEVYAIHLMSCNTLVIQ